MQSTRIAFGVLATATVALAAAWGCGDSSSDDGGSVTNQPPRESGASTSSSSSGSSGTSDAGTGGDAGALPCPGTGGPDPIRVTTKTTSFCIDRSEVTRGQYALFLASTPSAASQGPECAWNTTFVPNAGWPDGGVYGAIDAPVTNVDWCDAVAYCKSVGKHLCRTVTGTSDAGAGAIDEWYLACSHDGERKYPYGSTQDLGACNGPDGGHIKPVMAQARCEGGYEGVFDMTGNVQEWRDAPCQKIDGGMTPKDDACLLGGGGFGQAAENESCTTLFLANRSGAFDDLGFRCCSP